MDRERPDLGGNEQAGVESGCSGVSRSSTDRINISYAVKGAEGERSASTERLPESNDEVISSDLSTDVSPSLVSTGMSGESLTSSRSSTGCEAISISIKSRYVCFREKGIYVGNSKDMPVPKVLEQEWVTIVRPRLVNDLRQVLRELPRSLSMRESIVEPEFCMAGEVNNGADTVELKPTIWIRCGSKKCRKSIRKATADLKYLETFAHGQIQVHLRAPRPAAFHWGPFRRSTRPAPVSSAEKDTNTTVDDRLILQIISHRYNESACGMKLKIRRVQAGGSDERICTVGGLVEVGGEIYGLTTAHAFYELEENSKDNALHDVADDSDPDSGFSSDTSDAAFDELNAAERPQENNLCLKPPILPPGVTEIVDAKLAGIGYSGSSDAAESEQSLGQDFALIRIEFGADNLRFNNYVMFQKPTIESILCKYTIDCLDSQPEAGPITVICTQDDTNEGYLLKGESLFLHRDAVFRTRKIQTSSPLLLGTSGSWVVRGSSVVGMVVAAYDNECCAHIILISHVFSGINELLTRREANLNGRGVEIASNDAIKAMAKRDLELDDQNSTRQINLQSDIANLAASKPNGPDLRKSSQRGHSRISVDSGLSSTLVSSSSSSQGLETFKAALDIFEGIKTSVVSVEDSAMMIKRLEKKTDRSFKRTYMLGQPIRDVDDRAPVLKVGLSFLPGCDRPTVNRLEQTFYTPSKKQDQQTATWRVNTAGHLLNDFEVSNDLSYVTIDRTAEVAARARDRLNRQFPSPFSTPSSHTMVVRNRELDAVTIDSEQVSIVADLRSHAGEFDLESTLIEVDGPSLLSLMVSYKILIQRRDPASNLDENKTLLETMMEAVHRLYRRSPILFRMSTRYKIISSRNTRYGINHGREFTTLTTSKGIRELISLSAAYYSTLDADPKAQKSIRPRYLQMLVLLLSFLNDDDLVEIRPMLESTFKLQSGRRDLELLFLKVIPLASINEKLFLTSMVPAFEGFKPNEPIKPEPTFWDTFITRILPLGYILPGTVSQLGRNPLSWIIKWPEDGFKNSFVFHNLQYDGAYQTFNDIPPIEEMIDREDYNTELMTEMTNGAKCLIRTQDYEPIVCLTEGIYSVQPTQWNGNRADLAIKEEWLNQAARDAMRIVNPVIKHVNQWLMNPRRTNSRLSRLRSRRPISDIAILDECQISGRITRHTATLSGNILACAYKLDGRKLFVRDAVSLMAHDILEIESVVRYYELRLDEKIPSLEIEVFRWLKEQLRTAAALLMQAEASRRQLSQDPTISDEPIAKVIQPKGMLGRSSGPRIWYDYRTHVTAGNHLQMEAVRSFVTKVTWLSDAIVEVLLDSDPKTYFASPLEYVEEGQRMDEVQEGDVAVLAGQFMILAVPNDADDGVEGLIMTNYLRVTSVEEPALSARGANRLAGRGSNRINKGPSRCTFI